VNRPIAAALVLVAVAGGCGQDQRRSAEVVRVPADAFDSLAGAADDGPDPAALPVTAWAGGVLVVGRSGGAVLVDADGGTTDVATDGLDATVDAVTSAGGRLLALGHEGSDPVAWRSVDARHWERLEAAGLDSAAGAAEVAGMLADDEARGFVAYGEVREGDQSVLSLWGSADGASWAPIEAPGLDQHDADAVSLDHLVGLAQVGPTLLAVREATGPDDSVATVVRGRRGQAWELLDPGGLDDLDLPNSDVLPPIAASGDDFVLLANEPTDDDDEFGMRRATLLASTDGEDWEEVASGPDLAGPYGAATLVATPDGVTAVLDDDGALVLWEVPR